MCHCFSFFCFYLLAFCPLLPAVLSFSFIIFPPSRRGDRRIHCRRRSAVTRIMARLYARHNKIETHGIYVIFFVVVNVFDGGIKFLFKSRSLEVVHGEKNPIRVIVCGPIVSASTMHSSRERRRFEVFLCVRGNERNDALIGPRFLIAGIRRPRLPVLWNVSALCLCGSL